MELRTRMCVGLDGYVTTPDHVVVDDDPPRALPTGAVELTYGFR